MHSLEIYANNQIRCLWPKWRQANVDQVFFVFIHDEKTRKKNNGRYNLIRNEMRTKHS